MRRLITLLALSAVGMPGAAWSQPKGASSTGPDLRLRKDIAPQLYYLKIQGLLQDRLKDPKAWRYDKQARLRVLLDDTGAVVQHDWISRTALPVYDQAINALMAEFGPDAKGRLPLPTDPDILKQVTRLGVVVTLRFRGTQPAPSDGAPAKPAKPAKKER